MGNESVNRVMEHVADILRRVSKRNEVEEYVAQEVDFSELVNDLIKQPGPVRDAAAKVVANHLRSFEIESGSDEEAKIIGAVDFEKLVPQLLADEQVRGALQKAMISRIETGADNSRSELAQTIEEALGFNDAEKLKEVVGKDHQAVDEALADKVVRHVENLNFDELSRETLSALEGVLFSEDRIARIFQQNPELDQKVEEIILDWLENGEQSGLSQILFKSKALEKALDSALEQISKSGRLNEFIETATADILKDPDSGLSEKLHQAISDRLIGRIADILVGRLFEPQQVSQH